MTKNTKDAIFGFACGVGLYFISSTMIKRLTGEKYTLADLAVWLADFFRGVF